MSSNEQLPLQQSGSAVPPTSASLLRAIIDSGREAVLVVDAANLTLVDVSAKACQLLGYQRDELIRKTLSSVECSLLDVFFWDELSRQGSFEGVRVAETEWMRCDGTAFHVEKQVSTYSENGANFWIIHAYDLTARRKTDQQHLQLVSQLQSALESTAEGILSIDLLGNVINFNRRFALMWGLPDTLFAEDNSHRMWEHILSTLTDDTDLIASLERSQIEQHIDTEDFLTLRDGRVFICVSKPEFVRDSLIGRVFSVRDITTIKRIETDLLAARDIAEQASIDKSAMLDALQVSESRLRRLVNSSLIGIMQGEVNGTVFEANDVLLNLIGLDQQKFAEQGLNWHQLTCHSAHTFYENKLKDLQLLGQTPPFEVELIRADGSTIPTMIGLAKLEGSTTEWVGFVLDLTKQRESDRIKADFISVVSHELRTPLTSIHGSLGLIDSGVCGALPEGAKNLVSIALKNSQRLGVLVNDLLDMEKLASGKMTMHIERLNLIAVTKQAIEANTGYAQSSDISFVFTQHPKQAWALGDTNRLMQVFANLLSNAVKFSHSGGVVEVKLLDVDGVYKVEIHDHGVGIEDKFKERIFKKFAQADDGNTRRQGGTGLGLNITKRLVEKMGGEIGFRSQVGVGSVFWFTVLSGVQRVSDH